MLPLLAALIPALAGGGAAAAGAGAAGAAGAATAAAPIASAVAPVANLAATASPPVTPKRTAKIEAKERKGLERKERKLARKGNRGDKRAERKLKRDGTEEEEEDYNLSPQKVAVPEAITARVSPGPSLSGGRDFFRKAREQAANKALK